MRCVVASPRSGGVISPLSRVARGVCITGLVARFFVAAAVPQVPGRFWITARRSGLCLT